MVNPNPVQRYCQRFKSFRQGRRGRRRDGSATASRRHILERRDQEIRRRELAREDLLSKLNQDAVFRSNVASDDRVENRRRLREQRMREQEQSSREEILEAARKRIERELMMRRQQELAEEQEKLALQRLREEKERQFIRENSEELKQLEKKLNYAYMNKERSLQLQEKAYDRQLGKIKEAEQMAEMTLLLEKAKQEEAQKEKEAQERSVMYNKALADQLEEQEEKKKAEFELFLREKEMVDEIVRRIMEEDQRDAEMRLEKQRETKQYIEQFMAERANWKRLDEERQAGENAKILAYAELQRQREEEIQKLKATRTEERNLIYDKLSAEMERHGREKEEFEQLRLELYQEEQEEAARIRDERLLQERIRRRLELIDAYRNQMLEKRKRQMQAQQEEEEFRQKMMQKYAEDEKLEQMNAQKRRMKQLEHKRAVDALIEERRRIRLLEQEKLLEEERREADLEKYRQAVVEQERQRLLREHAVKLLGYLPKGVLRDQKDLDLFDEEFRRKFEIHL